MRDGEHVRTGVGLLEALLLATVGLYALIVLGRQAAPWALEASGGNGRALRIGALAALSLVAWAGHRYARGPGSQG
jgi:hypothetical protein